MGSMMSVLLLFPNMQTRHHPKARHPIARHRSKRVSAKGRKPDAEKKRARPARGALILFIGRQSTGLFVEGLQRFK
ncbi:MAG: hypothetical protein NWQ37_11535, partial [Marivita lacus]|nr:hypothetical protein [Marivita lacus]